MEFKLPELGENITSADVVKILVKPGDTVKRDQSVLELETDKAVIELPSPVDGVVRVVQVKEGERVSVGQVVMMIDVVSEKVGVRSQDSGSSSRKPEAGLSTEAVVAKPESKKSTEKIVVAASPMVRRLARELGVDISQMTGTGFKGRITFDDVKQFVFSGRAAEPHLTLPDFSKWGPIEKKPMSQVRLKTAKNVAMAWAHIPHVTQFDDADLTRLEELRKREAPRVKEKGGHLTVTALMVKVVAESLKEFPRLNASLDMTSEQIIFKQYYHVGIAVDTDRGLIVPVIRDADKKSIVELAVELPKLAEKARNKTLTLNEMQGGTFTITNLGGIGGTYFTPIIHTTQVAILGLGRTKTESSRLMLPLSLSYDHRLIDGADAARFLRRIALSIEQFKEI